MVRRAAVALARIVVSLALVALSLVAHLPTRGGLLALRDVLAIVLPGNVPGHLRIGSIDRLASDEIRVSQVRYADEADAPLLEDATVRIRPASSLVGALFRGAPMPPIEVHARRVWARVPFFTPTPPPQAGVAPPPPPTQPTRLPAIRVTVDEMRGAIPGVELAGRGITLDLGVTAGDQTALEFRRLGMTLDVMGLQNERVELRGRMVTGTPLRLDAAVSLRGPSLNCDARANTDDAGLLRAHLGDCVLGADGLNTLARRDAQNRLDLALSIRELQADATAEGAWRVRTALRVNDQPVEAEALVSPASQTADVSLHHFDARRLMATAPVTDLDGVVHLERHVEGDTQRFVVDTSRLVAAASEVPVPPVRLAAHLERSLLTIDELTSPDIGLRANGSVDLEGGASTLHAVADLETNDLSRYPWVAGRASGGLRVHAEVNGQGGRFEARARGTAQRLRVATARVASASFDLTGVWADGRATVDSTVIARQLSVPGTVGPADVTVHAQGDPQGRLRARVMAQGDGLLTALGPRAAGSSGDTRVNADLDLDLSHPEAPRVRVTQSNLTLRGVRARVSGDVAMLRGARAGSLPHGRVRVETEGHGNIAVELTSQRIAANLGALDLAWLRPLVPGMPALSGIADGVVDINPRDLRSARASLWLSRASMAPVGDFSARVELTPEGGASTMHLALESTRAGVTAGRHPGVDATVHLAMPRQGAGADAWFDAFQSFHIVIDEIDLAAWNDLMPTGLGAQGRAKLVLDGVRPSASQPLHTELSVEARNLTGGLRLAGRLVPATVPMTLRVAACLDTRRPVLDESETQVRIALAPWHQADPEPEARGCRAPEPLLPRSLVAFDGGLTGPWFSSLRDAAQQLRSPSRRLDAATQERLRRTTVNLRALVGPVLRAEWPFRAVPVVGADGRPRMLQAPDVPADAMVRLEATASGPALNLGSEVNLDLRTGSLAQAGIDEPIEAHLLASLRPATNDTLLGHVNAQVDGAILLSPNAPVDERGQFALSFRGHGNGASLLSGSTDAAVVDVFEVDTSSLALQRFAWARTRGMRGAAALSFNLRDNGRHGASAWVRLSDLRARLGGDDERRETPPVAMYTDLRLVPAAGGWTLRTCLHATTAQSQPTCDATASAPPDGESALVALATVPVQGSLFAPQVVAREAEVRADARRFRLETLTPLVRDDNIAGIAGALEASLRWDGRRPEALASAVRVSGGRAEVISLGEPLRELEMDLRVDGARATLTTLDADIGRGHIAVHGGATLDGLLATLTGRTAQGPAVHMELAGETRQMPLGVEGNTYGWVDGTIRYTMDFAGDGANGNLAIERASILLKEEQSRDLQSLSPDRDVFILGRTVVAANRAAAAYPMSVSFETETPMWIRRSDLAVALRARGDVRRERAGWGVAGIVEQANTQSWFSVLGKRFELDRMRVVLEGLSLIHI